MNPPKKHNFFPISQTLNHQIDSSMSFASHHLLVAADATIFQTPISTTPTYGTSPTNLS